MSSPVHLTLRPPVPAVLPAGGAGSFGPPPAVPHEDGSPLQTVPAAAPHAAVSIACSREGLARARSFTRATLGDWSDRKSVV